MKCERQHVVKFGFSLCLKNCPRMKTCFKSVGTKGEKTQLCLLGFVVKKKSIASNVFINQMLIIHTAIVESLRKFVFLYQGEAARRRHSSKVSLKTSPHCVVQSVNNVRLICCRTASLEAVPNYIQFINIISYSSLINTNKNTSSRF